MHELPIRKVPGIGRVNERLLEAIGVKASPTFFAIIFSLVYETLDLWRYLSTKSYHFSDG